MKLISRKKRSFIDYLFPRLVSIFAPTLFVICVISHELLIFIDTTTYYIHYIVIILYDLYIIEYYLIWFIFSLAAAFAYTEGKKIGSKICKIWNQNCVPYYNSFCHTLKPLFAPKKSNIRLTKNVICFLFPLRLHNKILILKCSISQAKYYYLFLSQMFMGKSSSTYYL